MCSPSLEMGRFLAALWEELHPSVEGVPPALWEQEHHVGVGESSRGVRVLPWLGNGPTLVRPRAEPVTPLTTALLCRSWEQKWCLPQVRRVTGRPQGCGGFLVGRTTPEWGTLRPPPPHRAQGERPLLSTQSSPAKDSCLCGYTEALSDLESTEMIIPLIL